ncbi:Na+/H+ antiporter NhaC family protein [Candidatus Riflebacteria bacterium]
MSTNERNEKKESIIKWIAVLVLVFILIYVLGKYWAIPKDGKLLKNFVPGFTSILPPLLAIAMALIFKEVISSLFLGVMLGSFLISHYAGEPIWYGLPRTFGTYINTALMDPDRLKIITFSCLLAVMIQIIQDGGGVLALIKPMLGWVDSRKSLSLSTFLSGLFVFFDDYANTMIVGNSFRPLYDRMRVSREKLSYIVDSTAAPVAGVAFISTWIGFELGQFDSAFKKIGQSVDAYALFLQIIPFRFYCLLTLFFVFLVCYLGIDFGPMLFYEREKLEGGEKGESEAKESTATETNADSTLLQKEGHIMQAVIPIGSVLVITMLGLLYSGGYFAPQVAGKPAVTLAKAMSDANSLDVLFFTSLIGVVLAGFLSFTLGKTPLLEILYSFFSGFFTLLPAFCILILAWTLSDICKDGLMTGTYISGLLSGRLPATMVPVFIFICSALISFATGSSWATMGIVIPLAVEVGHTLGAFLPATLGAVLEGSIFGDHCSPISDTTVLSSLASGCDHINHVKTQMPYALTVAAVSLFLGYLPAGYLGKKYPDIVIVLPYLSLLMGALVLYLILIKIGSPIEVKRVASSSNE